MVGASLNLMFTTAIKFSSVFFSEIDSDPSTWFTYGF